MADENSSAAANDSGPRSGRMLWRKASGKIAVVASAAKFQELFKSLPPPKPVNPSTLLRSEENIRVIVRCRPLNEREKSLGGEECVDLDPASGGLSISGRAFAFDSVFPGNCTQEAVYDNVMGGDSGPMEKYLAGFNVCIFAYGQTGSGKTFSMIGSEAAPELLGIVPRTLQNLFGYDAKAAGLEFEVTASVLEIYNEHLRDLLATDSRTRLSIRENREGVFVDGLKEVPVSSAQEAGALLDKANEARHVGATNMNAHSSRSHLVFTLKLTQRKIGDATGYSKKTSQMHMVDLAGSERADSTGATGERLKEGAAINQSLSALGQVINSLVKKKKHIPYRDSHLTRMLQSSLGGNSSTLMLAAISPAKINEEETVSTLRFAERAKQIQNKAHINIDPKNQLIEELKAENEALKAKLAKMESALEVERVRAKVAEMRARGDLPPEDSSEVAQLQARIAELEAEAAAKDVLASTQSARASELRAAREVLEADAREQAQRQADSGAPDDEVSRDDIATPDSSPSTPTPASSSSAAAAGDTAPATSSPLAAGDRRSDASRMREELLMDLDKMAMETKSIKYFIDNLLGSLVAPAGQPSQLKSPPSSGGSTLPSTVPAVKPPRAKRCPTITSSDLQGEHLEPPADLLGPDAEFAPNSRSLGGQLGTGAIIWGRPHEFGIEGLATVCKHPSPDDIKQGALGDCYFLSSLSVLAEEPQRVTRLFREARTDDNGIQWFTVTMKVGGKWRVICVDDHFPIRSDSKQLAFSRSSDATDLWVPVAEKAWAKLHGSYEEIEAGDPAMVLSCLTGAPCDSMRVPDSAQDPEWAKVWEKIVAAAKENLMTAASTGNSMPTSNGLVAGHAYAVLDAREVEGHRLLKIRNPWGTGEWEGDWSDDSDLWTDCLRAELEWSKSDDGIFWMGEADFCRYYEYATISQYREKWVYAEEEADLSETGAGEPVVLDVKESGPVYLSVHQPEKRLQPDGYEYNKIGFTLIKQISDSDFAHVDNSPIHQTAQVTERYDLEAGQYWVIPRTRDYKASSNCTVEVEAYSPMQVDVLDAPTDDPMVAVFKAYKHAALASSQISDLSRGNQPDIKFYTASVSPAAVFFHRHGGSGVRLEETITLECENYDIIEVDLQTWQGRHCGGGPGHTRSTVKLTLAPGDERMLVLQPDENMIGRSMSYRQSTSFGLQPI